jgi:hypothetical protein
LLLSSASTLIEPLQDRPQTASVLRLWQRANQLWCNTVTGGLHRPLGKWLVPGPQLRWVWPFYFDPDTQTFVLVFYLVTTGGLHNSICRQIDMRQHFRPTPSLLNAKRS